MTKYFFMLFSCLLAFASCTKENNPKEKDTLTFEFKSDTDGWTGDFTDYPVGEEKFYELKFKYINLPLPLDTAKKALMLSGNNHSDDLFMFIKKKIKGLVPDKTYEVIFDVEFASKAPTNTPGIGGSPGEGVTMKAGASTIEPVKIDSMDFYLLNIDKSNQVSSGKDMIAIGHVGVTDTTTVFALKSNNNVAQPFKIKTDSNGEVWVIIGTDSGHEGATTLYYNKIVIWFN